MAEDHSHTGLTRSGYTPPGTAVGVDPSPARKRRGDDESLFDEQEGELHHYAACLAGGRAAGRPLTNWGC